MHSLKQYLKSVEEPITEFAARVGASRQTLYRIISRAQAPKPALARRIVEATGGAVSLEALYQDAPHNVPALAGGAGDAVKLDDVRLKTAIAAVYNHFAPKGAAPAPDALVTSAVVAAMAVHEALSAITSRAGTERLAQALRPVLAEVLSDCGIRLAPHILERAAKLGAELYFDAFEGLSKQLSQE